MFASERAAFLTSSNTWVMAGLAPTMFSSPSVCWSWAAQVPVLHLEPAMARRPLHRDAQLLDGEILREIVERPFLDGGHGRLDGREPRHHDDRQGRVQLVRATQERHAVHVRHPEIGQEHVGPRGLEQVERAARIRRGDSVVARAAQDP